MAEGSHGWRPNCADFPAAANTRPSEGRVKSMFSDRINICWVSHELRFMASQAMLRISPISPMRL